MLNSMTGFARETADTPFGTMTCEMRAVNHRFLDIQFRLPEELRAKEIELRNRIGESLKRGKVECSVYLKRGKADTAELNVNEGLVEQLAARASEISKLELRASPFQVICIGRRMGNRFPLPRVGKDSLLSGKKGGTGTMTKKK